MVPALRHHLERQGFQVYPNPDGTDYFDLVARRGGEIGLVELKLNRGGAVLHQALRRRAWGAWTAIALASERTARRLVTAPTSRLRSAVGIWYVQGETVEVLRPARLTPDRTRSEMAGAARAELGRWLDRVDRGELPPGVRWEGLRYAVGRFSGGRRFKEWTIEEASASGEQG